MRPASALLALALAACAHLADRDGDGLPDTLDLCPDAPEDIDGFEDQDGCPEFDCDDCCSSISQRAIPFRPGRSTIPEKAHTMLNHIADELRARADLTRVEVRGPASRAAAVRRYLIARGVATTKLAIAEAPGPAVRFRIVESNCLPGG